MWAQVHTLFYVLSNLSDSKLPGDFSAVIVVNVPFWMKFAGRLAFDLCGVFFKMLLTTRESTIGRTEKLAGVFVPVSGGCLAILLIGSG